MRRIESSLAAGGFTLSRDSVAGRQVVIARRATLRLPTRRHTFVLVALFKADASRDHLDRFLEEAALYARTVRGGLAAGAWRAASVLAVAVVASAADAGGWPAGESGLPLRGPLGPGLPLRGPLGPGGAGILPVLVDLGAGRVTVGQQRPDAVLAALVTQHVVPAVRPGATS